MTEMTCVKCGWRLEKRTVRKCGMSDSVIRHTVEQYEAPALRIRCMRGGAADAICDAFRYSLSQAVQRRIHVIGLPKSRRTVRAEATVQNMRSLIPIFSPIFLLYVHRLHQDKRAAHRRESPTRPITVQLSSQSFALSPLHSSWLDDAKPPHRHIPFHQMQSSKIASHPFTAPSPTQLARRTDPINHPEMQCIQPTKHSLATPETAFPTVVPLAHPHAQLL